MFADGEGDAVPPIDLQSPRSRAPNPAHPKCTRKHEGPGAASLEEEPGRVTDACPSRSSHSSSCGAVAAGSGAQVGGVALSI